jgi:hypothetical protein
LQKPGAGRELHVPDLPVARDRFGRATHRDTRVLELEASALKSASRSGFRPEIRAGGGGQDKVSGCIQHAVGGLLFQAFECPRAVGFLVKRKSDWHALAIESDLSGQILRGVGHVRPGQDVALRCRDRNEDQDDQNDAQRRAGDVGDQHFYAEAIQPRRLREAHNHDL